MLNLFVPHFCGTFINLKKHTTLCFRTLSILDTFPLAFLSLPLIFTSQFLGKNPTSIVGKNISKNAGG